MCVGVQNTKKKKKLSVLWAIAQLRVIQTTHVRRGVPKHTYTVLFSLLIVITQQWRKVALRQLQDFLLKFAALWQRTDGLLYSYGIFSKVFLRSLSLLGRIFAFSFSLVKKKTNKCITHLKLIGWIFFFFFFFQEKMQHFHSQIVQSHHFVSESETEGDRRSLSIGTCFMWQDFSLFATSGTNIVWQSRGILFSTVPLPSPN